MSNQSLTRLLQPFSTATAVPDRCRIGIAAVGLPLKADGSSDFDAMIAAAKRTVDAGFIVAAPVDTTGKLDNIMELNQQISAEIAQAVAPLPYFAGVTAKHEEGQSVDRDAIYRDCEAMQHDNTVFMVMTNYGFQTSNEGEGRDYVETHHGIGRRFGAYIMHILEKRFTPAGFIPKLGRVGEILADKKNVGFKTSSWDPTFDRLLLHRGRAQGKLICATGHDDLYVGQLVEHEWLKRKLEGNEALEPLDALSKLGDSSRSFDEQMGLNHFDGKLPAFGFDALLGAMAFTPERHRDLFEALAVGAWQRYAELAIPLQEFARFVFRQPTPAYRHDLHIWWHLLGHAQSPNVPAGWATRDENETEKLRRWAEKLEYEVVN